MERQTENKMEVINTSNPESIPNNPESSLRVTIKQDHIYLDGTSKREK